MSTVCSIIKVCSLCGKVQKYNKGDRLPHWALLYEPEWAFIIKIGYREHHTLCPKCKQSAHEKEVER